MHVRRGGSDTAEVPLYRRLVEACTIVDTAMHADVVVVASWHGTASALGWRPPGRGAALNKALKAPLSEAALAALVGPGVSFAKVLILNSVDAQMLPTGLEAQAPRLLNATYVHLGDTQFNKLGRCAAPKAGSRPRRSCRNVSHFPNSLVVPHRTSQWLPLGFPPPTQNKTVLLLANLV